MSDTTTAQQSLWLAEPADRQYPQLRGRRRVDVAVVGAGLVGLTTAVLLARRGLDVAVLEARRVGSGVSGNNTAKVTALQSTRLSTVESLHGEAAARTYAAAAIDGVALLARLAGELEIDCDLQRRPAATFAYTADERSTVEREAEAADRAGLPVEWAEQLSLPFTTHGAVVLPEQVLLHPLKYVRGLAEAVHGAGGVVYEDSPVVDLGYGNPNRVHTSGGSLHADHVVIATHYPLLDRGGYFARLEPERSYCVAARLKSGRPADELAISAGRPSWSVSVHGDQLIVGGQSHPSGERGIDTTRYTALADFARAHFDVEVITHRWSAQDPQAYDSLPMVGTYLPGSTRLWVATGFAKWGLSMGTVAAAQLADQLTGQDNPYARLFSPHRVSPRGLPTLVRMNAKVAKDFVGDRLTVVDARTPDDIPPGEARVLPDGAGKKGVYKDADGRVHAVSLRCTHLGCLLRFNGAERSWDCPCHGSRFDVDGAVLEGPAVRPLARREPGSP